MTKESVAVLGLGLMGAAVARAFAAGGHEVLVWNRTPAKAKALAGPRLTPVADVGAALAAGLIVNLTGQCAQLPTTLAGHEGALAGKAVLNLASGTPAEVRATGAWLAGHGALFCSGTILAYPESMGKAGTSIMVGGDAALWEGHADTIRAVAGAASFVAEDAGVPNVLEAAMVGGFYLSAYAAFIEAARFMQLEGLDPALLLDNLPALTSELRRESIQAVAEMQANAFPTDQATVDTYLRSHTLFLAAYGDAGAPSDMLAAVRTKLARAAANGRGSNSFAVLARG